MFDEEIINKIMQVLNSRYVERCSKHWTPDWSRAGLTGSSVKVSVDLGDCRSSRKVPVSCTTASPMFFRTHTRDACTTAIACPGMMGEANETVGIFTATDESCAVPDPDPRQLIRGNGRPPHARRRTERGEQRKSRIEPGKRTKELMGRRDPTLNLVEHAFGA